MEITMKKCIVDIYLVDSPIVFDIKSKETFDGGDLYNRAEGFKIVNAFFLCITSYYQSCLVSFNCAIRSLLDLVDPLTRNAFFPGGRGTISHVELASRA